MISHNVDGQNMWAEKQNWKHKMKQIRTRNGLKFIATVLIRSHCNVNQAPDTKR